jgi:orotate phosphoribosyltransferase
MNMHASATVLTDPLDVAKILFETPGVVNLSDRDEYEVQPDVYSSVYVNLKSLASNYLSRIEVAKALAVKFDAASVDYVCGMELGGCYFASHVADLFGADLFFYRKGDKKYNIKNCFAGNIPTPGSRVVLIDDVLSSGNTIARAVRELTEIGCTVNVVCIFSYCWDKQIATNLNVPVSSLATADHLIEYGTTHNLMTNHNTQLIREYIEREENRLVQPQESRN